MPLEDPGRLDPGCVPGMLESLQVPGIEEVAPEDGSPDGSPDGPLGSLPGVSVPTPDDAPLPGVPVVGLELPPPLSPLPGSPDAPLASPEPPGLALALPGDPVVPLPGSPDAGPDAPDASEPPDAPCSPLPGMEAEALPLPGSALAGPEEVGRPLSGPDPPPDTPSSDNVEPSTDEGLALLGVGPKVPPGSESPQAHRPQATPISTTIRCRDHRPRTGKPDVRLALMCCSSLTGAFRVQPRRQLPNEEPRANPKVTRRKLPASGALQAQNASLRSASLITSPVAPIHPACIPPRGRPAGRPRP